MSSELLDCAASGDLERVIQLVKGGANIDYFYNAGVGMTALIMASLHGEFEIVAYLVKHGANVAQTDGEGMTAIHWACANGSLLTVKCLVEHGAKITERDTEGRTALLQAAQSRRLTVIQYLLSSEGGASISETDNEGNTALLLAAGVNCYPTIIQWLLEYGGAQITDTDDEGDSVWTVDSGEGLPNLLKSAHTKSKGGEYVSVDGKYIPNGDIVALTAMLRVIVLHGSPPDTLTADLAPPFQRIVQHGTRLLARLPAYLAQRRVLSDDHCPLLAPLTSLVHDYEKPTTTDELWATGLGASLRPRLGRGQSPERRSARLHQKCHAVGSF